MLDLDAWNLGLLVGQINFTQTGTVYNSILQFIWIAFQLFVRTTCTKIDILASATTRSNLITPIGADHRCCEREADMLSDCASFSFGGLPFRVWRRPHPPFS
jgi:hypothetical protein